MDTNTIKHWNQKANEFLKGKTIKECRYLTEEEMNGNGWYKNPVVIFFTDGSYLIPQSDNEGNEAGVLLFINNNNSTSEILPAIS